ncbi:MAG: hypothetical protein C4527_22180 [Candidatus Omnitrophota bacterium]|jgi:hypothetical protein|nr:MAG: hypothetical protein C4527_22180 [Candidatus Omnitrophota bacterium]
MQKRFFFTMGIIAVSLLLSNAAVYSQPIGETIELIDDTPTFAEVENLVAITPNGPVILAKTSGEDREPKLSVLNNGTTSVFWVNRSGSHHVSGVDVTGQRIFDVFEDAGADDILMGVNTGGNTNWTLNKADRVNGNFLAAATFQYNQLFGTGITLPDTVVDADGYSQDDGQGHGFFRLFNDQLQPITPTISISQFSAGHREWDCCWLSDGKFVIGTVCQEHRYEADPDYPAGGNKIATINIFNADGSRFADEFFVAEDLTGTQGDLRLGSLANGFVAIYKESFSGLVQGIIFDNDGNRIKKFVVTDETFGIGADWMDAGGGNTFVTIHQINGKDGMGLPDDLLDFPIILGQVWNDQGERVGPYVVASQQADGRGLGRPRCAMAPNGTFVLSWEDALADDVQFTKSVVGRIFNADGSPACNAFVVHPLPEFADSNGGDPGEPICGMNNDIVSFAWGSRAVPNGAARDIVTMAYQNPAMGTEVASWEVY